MAVENRKVTGSSYLAGAGPLKFLHFQSYGKLSFVYSTKSDGIGSVVGKTKSHSELLSRRYEKDEGSKTKTNSELMARGSPVGDKDHEQ